VNLVTSECTSYEKRNSIALLTLNRPQVLNALNRKLWREIYENLILAEKDGEIRSAIITGSGKAFSAGDDIKEISTLNMEEIRTFFIDSAVPTIKKIVEFPKPIIAAVNGLAYGGGCEIAMLCDLVVASESATFAVPEALIGAIPPIASVIGPHLIGKLNIAIMILTGEPISADEAKLIGLANIVVPDGELLVAAEKLARRTMKAAPSSIRIVKKLLYRRFKEELERAVEELISIVQTEEGKEGHRAFAEKRPPKWVKP
jgi:enoyl-CoA hydratase/3-hydroxyacyl-CoA dehydrogenase